MPPEPLDPAVSSLLAAFPVVTTWPVQWGDQDSFRHVNNTVYFRWMESARIDYTQRLGLGEFGIPAGVAPILAAVACDYRRQVTFPDTVAVGSRVVKIGRTSLTMEHAIVSVAAVALAAEGRSTLVLFDYSVHRPTPIPDSIRRGIEAVEGRTF